MNLPSIRLLLAITIFVLSSLSTVSVYASPKIGTANLSGTETSSGANFNQAALSPVSWSASEFDAGYFSHDPGGANPEQLTITSDGDYFFSYTIPLIATGQRITVHGEIYINGVIARGSMVNPAI